MGKIERIIKYKSALMQAGITQRQLAEILGISESYISMIIAGKRENRKFDEWIKPLLNLNGVII